MTKKNILSITFVFLFGFFNAQINYMDSLKLALKNVKHDTTRCNILKAMIEVEGDDTVWPIYNEELKSLVETKLKILKPNEPEYKFYKKYYAYVLNNFGFIWKRKGDIPKALDYYSKSLKIQEAIGDKYGLAISLNNIGVIYKNQGDIFKALDYFGRSLKIQEEIGDKGGVALSLNNIALIYGYKGDPSITSSKEEALRVGKIKALEYYTKLLKLREEIGDESGVASCMATIYSYQGNIPKALEYYEKCLKIEEERDDKNGVTLILNEIVGFCLKQKNYRKALDYSIKSMALSKELNYPENIKSSAWQLNQVYKAMGNYKLAYENYQVYITTRDNILSQENAKATIKSQIKYEYDKKAAADSVKTAEEKKVVAIQLKQEKTQRFALYGGLALVLLFAGFMFNRFKVTQKQKHIIELKEKETQSQNAIITNQKQLLEEKHTEIKDSINYAERIQRSMLASDELLNKNLKEHFVFFQPKDIVSGDFYWATSVKTSVAEGHENRFVLVTADSTGHGVPGAIMSILNTSCLKETVKEGYVEPSEILNHTRAKIIDILKNDGSAEGGKDGMDASLLSFDFKNNILHCASANNPIWIVRSSKSLATNELIEIKADRMPIGKHDNNTVPFTLHTFNLQKGDIVYTLTDGFADQFGGEKGKKFMHKQLKELLISIAMLPMKEQKQRLKTVLDKWMGNLAQIDDITIIGVRI